MKSILLILICLLMTIARSQETTTIYLIRHAEKADGSSDPDISEAGKKRAQKWAEYFKDKDIRYFYTTPYKRTTQTMLAASSYTNIGQEGSTIEMQFNNYAPASLSLQDIAKKHKGHNILVVGHSNTIPGYINRLIDESKYPDMQESEFGNLYIVTIKGDTFTHELIKM